MGGKIFLSETKAIRYDINSFDGKIRQWNFCYISSIMKNKQPVHLLDCAHGNRNSKTL